MSAATKWTPGEYKRTGAFLYALDPEQGINRWSAHVQVNNLLATDEEVEAVAALFQAAPRLYEALEFILSRCQLYGPADRAREMGEQALAEARGETTT